MTSFYYTLKLWFVEYFVLRVVLLLDKSMFTDNFH